MCLRGSCTLRLRPGQQVLGRLDGQRLLSAATLSRSHRACGSLNFKSQEAGLTWGPRSSLGAFGCEMDTGSLGFGTPQPLRSRRPGGPGLPFLSFLLFRISFQMPSPFSDDFEVFLENSTSLHESQAWGRGPWVFPGRTGQREREPAFAHFQRRYPRYPRGPEGEVINTSLGRGPGHPANCTLVARIPVLL